MNNQIEGEISVSDFLNSLDYQRFKHDNYEENVTNSMPSPIILLEKNIVED